MSEESEKRKSKKKSKHRKGDFDDDYVEKEVAKAMKQMEKAMKQAKLAEKEARRARKEGSSGKYDYNVNVTGDPSDPTKSGMTVIHNTVTHPGTYIHVESAENLQVGSNNTMYVYKDKKNGKKSSKKDLSSDSDGEAAPVRQKTVPVQDKNLSEMTEAERRIYNVLHSVREVTRDDINVCCEHVGNWRRFLRHLGLEDGLLEQIYQDYHAEGVRQIIYQGVIEWTRKDGRNATIGALARTLQKVDYADALNYLQP